jgi:hypothetical protein
MQRRTYPDQSIAEPLDDRAGAASDRASRRRGAVPAYRGRLPFSEQGLPVGSDAMGRPGHGG